MPQVPLGFWCTRAKEEENSPVGCLEISEQTEVFTLRRPVAEL